MNDGDFLKLAQAAYHDYGSVTDFKNYQGLPMPQWNDLTPRIQQAWIAAVHSIFNHLKSDFDRLDEMIVFSYTE